MLSPTARQRPTSKNQLGMLQALNRLNGDRRLATMLAASAEALITEQRNQQKF